MQVYCQGEAKIRRAGQSGDLFTIRPEDLDWHEGGIMTLGEDVRLEHTAYFTHPELGFLQWAVWESPVGVEVERETDVGEHTLIQDFDFGLEYTDEELAERQALVEEAVTWFLERYEDPAVRTGYDTEEGGYMWDHGGPFDARDEIADAFELPDDLLDRAVREVESSGTYEWAAKDWLGNDQYDGPEDQDFDGISSVEEPLPDQSDFTFDVGETDDGLAEGLTEELLEIPEQGPGLAFRVSDAGAIELAGVGILDDTEYRETAQLRTVLARATHDLLTTLTGSNAFPRLASIAQSYESALEEDALSIDLLYGLGVRLENARERLRALIATGDYPDLSAEAGEALDSILALHGPLILSTQRGRYLIELSQEYSKSDLDIAAYRAAAGAVAIAAINTPHLMSNEAADALVAATSDIGSGPHPERSLQVAHSGTRNVLITIAGAVALFVLKEPVAAGVAASLPGVALSDAIRTFADTAWAFLEANAPVLQHFVAASGFADMGWLSALLRRVAASTNGPR